MGFCLRGSVFGVLLANGSDHFFGGFRFDFQLDFVRLEVRHVRIWALVLPATDVTLQAFLLVRALET